MRKQKQFCLKQRNRCLTLLKYWMKSKKLFKLCTMLWKSKRNKFLWKLWKKLLKLDSGWKSGSACKSHILPIQSKNLKLATNRELTFIQATSKKLTDEAWRPLLGSISSQENKTGLGLETLIKLACPQVPSGMIEEASRLMVKIHHKTKGNTLVTLGTNTPGINST